MNTRSLPRSRPVLRHAGVAVCVGLALASGQGAAQTLLPDSFFVDRPAFSQPEQPGKPASCESITAQLPDSIPADSRVDMAIAGTVSLLRTDGALWYVAVCAEPGVRVLCVTYGAGDLKLGDRAVLRGGYNRQDKRHVLLDPCLASPESGEGERAISRPRIFFPRCDFAGDTRLTLQAGGNTHHVADGECLSRPARA